MQDIQKAFKIWLSKQNVKCINKSTSETTFKRFIKEYINDNYSSIALVINRFEKSKPH